VFPIGLKSFGVRPKNHRHEKKNGKGKEGERRPQQGSDYSRRRNSVKEKKETKSLRETLNGKKWKGREVNWTAGSSA